MEHLHKNCKIWTPRKFPAHICCKFLVLCDIHGNELCQILITGASHGVNPSVKFLWCVSNHGKDLRAYQLHQRSCIHGNELRQIDLIIGAPHGANLSLNMFDIPIHGEDLCTPL